MKPTVATGALVVALSLALVAVGGRLWSSLIPESEPVPPSCCAVPLEVIEGGRARVGCRGEPSLEGCGVLEPGDRVRRVGGRCDVERGAMSGGLRLLLGLGLDLNRASIEELQLLDGIGPSLADAIVQHRQSHGPFQQVEALVEVRGIGAKTLERLRSRIFVASPSIGGGRDRDVP